MSNVTYFLFHSSTICSICISCMSSHQKYITFDLKFTVKAIFRDLSSLISYNKFELLKSLQTYIKTFILLHINVYHQYKCLQQLQHNCHAHIFTQPLTSLLSHCLSHISADRLYHLIVTAVAVAPYIQRGIYVYVYLNETTVTERCSLLTLTVHEMGQFFLWPVDESVQSSIGWMIKDYWMWEELHPFHLSVGWMNNI